MYGDQFGEWYVDIGALRVNRSQIPPVSPYM